MMRPGLLLLASLTACTAWAQQTPLSRAATELAECRDLSNAEARLACYDASVEALARALEDSTAAATPPGTRSTADASSRRDPASDPTPEPAQPEADAESDLPEWAEAPDVEEQPRFEQPDRYTDTIVRITRNNLGRHYFYTEDGAVWMQTQIEEIRPPRSLPAQAVFRRKLTGNPTIQFDVSNRSYRVRRIE